ncbi:MAG: hypothetical protein RL596_878 [Bacteroidota bacterium]|jgi:hypothetical protein
MRNKLIILFNLIIPVGYIALLLLPRKGDFFNNNRLFIAEYGSGLIILQLLVFAIGCLLYRKRVIQVIFLSILLVFGILLFSTVSEFNPF